MKKKNLIVQAKLKKNRNLIQDKKIQNIYRIFRDNLFKNIKKEKFCIGVSGGPDSLTLAYLSKIYCKEFKTKFTTLIINHNLRKESTNEAKKIKSLLLKKNISSKILIWKGTIPKTGIQHKAREIRYNLLLKECYKLKINYLVLGHHVDDLVENFFIRLFRGSGLRGLSSFNVVSLTDKNNIKIIRPLISIKKKELINIAKKVYGFFIIDPSNFKEIFLRTRIRNYINNFKREGFDLNKVKLTINNLQTSEKSLNHYYQKAINKHVRYININKCLISNKLFINESDEIIFRIMGNVIAKIGNSYYPPRGKDLKNLIVKIKSDLHLKVTLGKCIIEKVNNSYLIKKEHNV